ncbi:MAG: hypothetical protein ABIN89_05500, partial [Chitinophagaceae bacterium]
MGWIGMDIGYQLSAIGYQLSAIGYRLSAIGYRLSAISFTFAYPNLLSGITYCLNTNLVETKISLQ